MNVTNGRLKDRQLHNEGYLQMVSAEQREYAEVSAYQRITENNGIITEFQTDDLLERILHRDNLNNAYKKVKSNKGAGGIDGMSVDELLAFLKDNQGQLIQQIKDGKYKPNPVRRVEIPKEEKGKVRKLGIPTVVDRVIQQAIAQVLTPIFEEQFSDCSFGFRPARGAHDALKQCQKNVNAKIYGDFFEAKPIEELEELLIHRKYDKGELDTWMDQVDISEYIHLLKNEDFKQLF